jgi:molybdopterin/thiamine biosynthesis adenylyltransferase
MRLKASLPAYKQIEVDVSPNRTVKELKATICEKLNIEPELTKLLLRGKALPEKLRLSKLKGVTEPLIVDYLWARHLILWGSKGQRQIQSASILLAGAGAIGNEVAKNLALLGVRRLFIVDRDNVELSNVSRMIFFEPSNLGKNKAEVLARNISKRYPYVETMAFRGDLEKLPLKFYLDSDVIVCGLDNAISRIFLAQTSRKYSIPLVDGGITGLNCRVHVYIPPADPCPICMFPPNQYSQIVGLRNPCDAPLEQETVPSLATTISLVSSIIAQETIKVILGLSEYREKLKWPNESGEPLRSVLFIDLKNNRFTPMNLKKGEKCFVCGSEGTAKEIVPRREGHLASIIDSKEALGTTIRNSLGAESNVISVLSETAHGSKTLDTHSPLKRGLKRGDYLRILEESKNSELRESILRLT